MSLTIRYIFDERLPSNQTDTEQVVSTVAALSRRGLRVELVIPEIPERPRVTCQTLCQHYSVAGDFSVTVVPSSFDAFRPLHKLAHSIKASRVGRAGSEVVYTRNLSSLAAALAAGERVVYDHFRPWPDQYPPLDPLLRYLLCHPRCLGMVSHSKHTRASYLRIGIPDHKIAVIHNGYEPSRLGARLGRREARGRLGLPHDKMIAVYAGRMNEKKGLEAVLSMAARCPDALFVLVGSEGEGPVERAARALNNVFIVPWQRPHDTATYLYAADVLLVPPSASPLTQHGTTVLPMKIFLYLAAGRVILAPNAPDTAEVLEHDHNAVLIPPGNIDAAVDALQALGRDELWRKRLERAALQSGHDLTWDGRAEKLERFLNERLTAIDPQSEATRSRKANWFRQTARWLYERTKRGAA